MLETFTLRQHLDTTRQELAQALYQHDAACRVIARLMLERDEARQQLSNLQGQGFVAPSATSAAASTAMAVDDAVPQNGHGEQSGSKETVGQLSEGVVQDLVSTCGELSAARKARKGANAPAAPSRDAVQALAAKETHTPLKDGKASLLCVAAQASFPISQVAGAAGTPSKKRGKAAAASEEPEAEVADGAVALCGASDKSVVLTQLETGRVLARLTGHGAKVNAVSFHCTSSAPAPAASTSLFSASADGVVKVSDMVC